MKNNIIKIGLKANANFLFSAMKGNTLGGYEGSILHASVIKLTKEQFKKFKELIISFGGNLEKSLIKLQDNEINYSCYFIENKNSKIAN